MSIKRIIRVGWKALLMLFVLFVTVFTMIDRVIWVGGENPGMRIDPRLLVKAGIHCPGNRAEARILEATMEYRCGIFGDSILWSLNRPRGSKKLMIEWEKTYGGKLPGGVFRDRGNRQYTKAIGEELRNFKEIKNPRSKNVDSLEAIARTRKEHKYILVEREDKGGK